MSQILRFLCGRVLNGKPGSRTPLMHLETGLNQSREEVYTDATWAIMLLLLPQLPVLPVISKWTKLGLALDFWLVGCVHSVLSLVLRAAQQGLHYPQQVLSAGEEDIGGGLAWCRRGGSVVAAVGRVTAGAHDPAGRG